MPAAIGRTGYIKKNNVVIAGIKNISLSWSGESVDVTTSEDLGKRLLLAESSQEKLDISFEGITKDVVFQALALGSASKMLTDITIEFPLFGAGSSGADISGNFRLVSYENEMPLDDAVTFTGSLESSGAWTYTAQA